jgi:hypothetical protein
LVLGFDMQIFATLPQSQGGSQGPLSLVWWPGQGQLSRATKLFSKGSTVNRYTFVSVLSWSNYCVVSLAE